MPEVNTIRVKHPDDPNTTMVINKSDYDENPTRYTIAKEPRKSKESDKAKVEGTPAAEKEE